eukprot:TRINITY_DN15629_c0_g1_i1.p1 TRINITY_DN15629_c0_g1~~TRINITY_DN15629_c0_g1_i1.p1  ORF type:complete len:247 (+),score=75.86 TRINITY_DN15629_c0_g1_i1:1-741(+)
MIRRPPRSTPIKSSAASDVYKRQVSTQSTGFFVYHCSIRMGISRDSVHKRRATGGKQKPWHKKRKYALGRPAALTKIDTKRIHPVRVRGGNLKFRALRLDTGNFSWGSESTTKKTRILKCIYSPSNNEFVRTNTLVKNTVVQVDATPFRQFYEQYYGIVLGKKKKSEKTKEGEEAAKKGKSALAKQKARQEKRQLSAGLEEQFGAGRLYAVVSSRPGQSGRADGYILEGPELDFYLKKIAKKKEKS